MKIFALIIKNNKLTVSIFLIIILAIIGIKTQICMQGDNISEPYQTIFISITITLFIYTISSLVNIFILYIKYKNIEGNYLSYSYKSDDEKDIYKDEYYELNENKNDVTASLKYIGNHSFIITVKDSTHEWEGDFIIKSENKAEISWWYIKPNKMKNCFGYKTAIIRRRYKDVCIVLFGEDKSMFGRELLIKNVED